MKERASVFAFYQEEQKHCPAVDDSEQVSLSGSQSKRETNKYKNIFYISGNWEKA